MVFGSPKTLVGSIDVSNIPTVILEEENSVLIKHFPRIIRSMLFSLLSFMKIIHLNKKFRFSLIHAQGTNYGAVAAIAASKLMDIPVVLHVHGINVGVIRLLIRPKWLARLYRAYYLFLQKESVKRSDCVICVSENNKKYLPTGKKIVIPMGVNTASFQGAQSSTDIREELGIPEHAFVLGYVGALSTGKGLNTLSESFYHVLREMPQETPPYLLIVGEGSERSGLVDLADQLGTRRYLRLTGFRNDIAKLLGTMDTFVFPSESEGSPMAVLEAMVAGKAIVACKIPAIREILGNGEAVLIDCHNAEELKRAILHLYHNPDLRGKLGRGAKERAKSYDVERVYSKILKVYEELIYNRTE